MGRWQPGAQGRLQHAAMELIAERGYDQVTVAEIAERAGLTERTFFRHFSDKREVLFAGQDSFVAGIAGAVAAAPPGTAPLDALVAGLLSVTASFDDDRRAASRARHELIAAHPELQERDRTKMAGLDEGLAAALRERGLSEAAAALVAAAGVAAFRLAFAQWIADPDGRDLGWHIRAAVDELRTVTAGQGAGHER